MVATLSVGGQQAWFLSTGLRRFVQASQEFWSQMDVSSADALLYADKWAQVDVDFLGVDLPNTIGPTATGLADRRSGSAAGDPCPR